LATVIIALGLMVAPVQSDEMMTRQERFGVAFITQVAEGSSYIAQSISEYNVAPLKFGWYLDWWFNASPDMPADTTLEYVQLIRVGDRYWDELDWDAVRNAATLNTSALWLIGNEPECPNQADLTPGEYADRFWEAYMAIKGQDPTARIAIGGIVEPTPLREQWLEEMLAYSEAQYGPLPPDVWWHIHIQILSEGAEGNPNAGAGLPTGIIGEHPPRTYSLQDCVDVNILKGMVWDFREWMADNEQRNRPLVISEMGVLQPSIYLIDPVQHPDEAERKHLGDLAIEDFMIEAFDWLLTEADAGVGYPDDEDHLVQRWLWYSMNGSFWDETSNPRGFNGAFYDYETKALTRFGHRFVGYQNADERTEMVYIPLLRK
jgi:hypothetical protein